MHDYWLAKYQFAAIRRRRARAGLHAPANKSRSSLLEEKKASRPRRRLVLIPCNKRIDRFTERVISKYSFQVKLGATFHSIDASVAGDKSGPNPNLKTCFTRKWKDDLVEEDPDVFIYNIPVVVSSKFVSVKIHRVSNFYS